MSNLPLVKKDVLLKSFEGALRYRAERVKEVEKRLLGVETCLNNVVNAHLYYGLHKTSSHWIFREKAPNAKQIFIIGDFSYWKVDPKYELKSLGNGDWEIELPLSFLKHGDLYKLWMVWYGGADERLPSYVRRVVQDDTTKVFSAQVWTPEQHYVWKNPSPGKPKHPLIYEAHVGMSSEKEEVSSYWAFKEYVLPRIKKLGYNTLQLMAIQEHPYYGSFGYQVSNFFAPSSRFGTPEELMELIDAAHGMGLYVILDVVHSHSVKNEKEGLSLFDGTDSLYFHSGSRGYHPVWNSRCFDYGKTDTILFLLSNLKYWLEEFHFDGFRFDGVTSMMYWNHGLGVDFLEYGQYFDDNVDEDAVTYLSLANKLIKQVNAKSLTIAEDVSGMPGMAFPVEKGGIGFDMRMSMGIADYWTKIIKKIPDEHWSVGDIYFRMTDHRAEENTVSYAESHDQAMVGDKTIIFQLMDKEMYTSMSVFTPSLVVDRGIALHKMIRLVTLALSSGGYLNFMGNEFGHPEWIDFPRQGNGWSYKYARRQWPLVEDTTLRYRQLALFDEAMVHFILKKHILNALPQPVVRNEGDQVLAFYRKTSLFVFNFSPNKSFQDYEIHVPEGKYKVTLNLDDPRFGGFGNVDETYAYETYQRENVTYLKLYLPARTAFVLTKMNK
ncbi:MAG: alpha amylase C-terminal domain-containing protein [Bacteroidales bacterium]|nr:alpha amylase C-terminal domain-containing protein [Bacteroidales bacterium]